MDAEQAVTLQEAVRRSWRTLAPVATWRGASTGWNALDLMALGQLVHRSLPALVVVAGGVGMGGMPLFVADCMDDNRRGKVVAGEKMGDERRRRLPQHRRLQWLPMDFLVEDVRTARRLADGAEPVIVVAAPSTALGGELQEAADLVTVGSYLVVAGDVATEVGWSPPERFLVDPAQDPLGLSSCTWLLRVPA